MSVPKPKPDLRRNNMKPILFDTQMVQAVLAGRKTVTRRPIRPQPHKLDSIPPPWKPGDILYVRETWSHPSREKTGYLYRADRVRAAAGDTWHPGNHMPKEAARLFLRVNKVHAEQLHDIFQSEYPMEQEGYRHGYDFIVAWEKAVRGADRETCEFEANPWVWVIEFERISKSEALLSS